MKKLISLFLLIIVMFSTFACNNTSNVLPDYKQNEVQELQDLKPEQIAASEPEKETTDNSQDSNIQNEATKVPEQKNTETPESVSTEIPSTATISTAEPIQGTEIDSTTVSTANPTTEATVSSNPVATPKPTNKPASATQKPTQVPTQKPTVTPKPTQTPYVQESEPMVEIVKSYYTEDNICFTFKSVPGETYVVFVKFIDNDKYYKEWKDFPHIAGEEKYINDKWNQPTFVVAESTETTYEKEYFYQTPTQYTFTVAHVAKDYSVYLSKYNAEGITQKGLYLYPTEWIVTEGKELYGIFKTRQDALACAEAYSIYGLTLVEFEENEIPEGPWPEQHGPGYHMAYFHPEGLRYENLNYVYEDLNIIIQSGKVNGWPTLRIYEGTLKTYDW